MAKDHETSLEQRNQWGANYEKLLRELERKAGAPGVDLGEIARTIDGSDISPEQHAALSSTFGLPRDDVGPANDAATKLVNERETGIRQGHTDSDISFMGATTKILDSEDLPNLKEKLIRSTKK